MKIILERVGKKVKAIRLNQNLKIEDAYEKGVNLLGENCISSSTMYRIETGEIPRFSTLEQYLYILNSNIKDILEDTEFEELLVLTKKEKISGFTYSENAFSTIINNPNHNFLAQEVRLKPSGKTDLDYAAKDKEPSHKLIYVVRGTLTCTVDNKEYIIKSNESVSFDSTKPHFFVNNSSSECIFTMVESPGRY